MTRITSPLNVAAGIFTIIAVTCVLNWNKTQKRIEKAQEQNEVISYLKEKENVIILEARNSLPVAIKEDKMSFESIELRGDTLEFKCSFSQPSTFFGITDGNSSRALVRMLYNGFHRDLLSLILVKAYYIGIRTNLSGSVFEEFVISPQEYNDAYNRSFEELPLKGFPCPRN